MSILKSGLIKPSLVLMTFVVLACSLSGCGKKPSHVDPPPWVEDDEFPRTYPDPTTDPAATPPVK